jgi:DNA-directed RNA polymerase subunit beta
MQSLALDVNVVSEEGTRAEMGDEDDDLLRAAEELGIDLSGVRNTDGAAADEAVEGEDATDASDDEPEADIEADVDAEIDMGDVELPAPDPETETA